MLYISIAIVICFVLYCKYKPEITINHTMTTKYPDEYTHISDTQSEKDVENQEDKTVIKSMDDAINTINNIMNGGE